jgi:predicted GTPase
MTKTIGNGSDGTSMHILLQGKGGVGKSLISAVLSPTRRYPSALWLHL